MSQIQVPLYSMPREKGTGAIVQWLSLFYDVMPVCGRDYTSWFICRSPQSMECIYWEIERYNACLSPSCKKLKVVLYKEDTRMKKNLTFTWCENNMVNRVLKWAGGDISRLPIYAITEAAVSQALTGNLMFNWENNKIGEATKHFSAHLERMVARANRHKVPSVGHWYSAFKSIDSTPYADMKTRAEYLNSIPLWKWWWSRLFKTPLKVWNAGTFFLLLP